MPDPTAVSEGPAAEARGLLAAGEYGRAREAALAALAESPGDPDLLRVAGGASLELGLDDAPSFFRRLTEVEPESPAAWRELADALVETGMPAEAIDVLGRLLELDPDDGVALVDRAHSLFVAGRPDEALAALEEAAGREPPSDGVGRSLVEMYRAAGREEEALAAAERLLERRPGDVLAALDVAELELALGRVDEAEASFARLRELDDEPEHEVFAYHGMIEAAILREEWRRALDLAVDATRVDRYGRTTDLLAFAVARVFGAGDRPAPSRDEVGAALEASRAEHRRLHAEALPF